MNPTPTLPEAIGMALGLAFLAFAALTAGEILRAIVISCGRDLVDGLRRLRTWWRNRRPEPGWQPKDHPRAPRQAIRRPR